MRPFYARYGKVAERVVGAAPHINGCETSLSSNFLHHRLITAPLRIPESDRQVRLNID